MMNFIKYSFVHVHPCYNFFNLFYQDYTISSYMEVYSEPENWKTEILNKENSLKYLVIKYKKSSVLNSLNNLQH